MERDFAPFHLERKGYYIHWDAVPAWVCTQCGESYFETQEVQLVQKALQVLEQETATLGLANRS